MQTATIVILAIVGLLAVAAIVVGAIALSHANAAQAASQQKGGGLLGTLLPLLLSI